MINKDKMQILYQKFKIAKITSDRARNFANSEMDIHNHHHQQHHAVTLHLDAENYQSNNNHLLTSNQDRSIFPLQQSNL